MHHHLMFAEYHWFFYIVLFNHLSLYSPLLFQLNACFISFPFYFWYIFFYCLYLSLLPFFFFFFGFFLSATHVASFLFIIVPQIKENHINWNVWLQDKITVHLPKMLPASGSSVRFRFFHSVYLTCNMLSHCSNIRKIAKNAIPSSHGGERDTFYLTWAGSYLPFFIFFFSLSCMW